MVYGRSMCLRRIVSACALGLLLSLTASAHAATVSGVVSVQRSGPSVFAWGPVTARWEVGGRVLPAVPMLAALGPAAATKGAENTDSRFVGAKLTSVTLAPETTPSCYTEGDGGMTRSIEGVSVAPAAFEIALRLDLLRGRGTAQLVIADGQQSGDFGSFFAPGRATLRTVLHCSGDEVRVTSVPLFSHAGSSLFSDDTASGWARVAWAAKHTATRTWTIAGVHTSPRDAFGAVDRIEVSASVNGTPIDLHATCHIPSARELHHARSWRAAGAILARAGFPAFRRRSRPLVIPVGHFMVDENVTGAESSLCGDRRLHLVLST
jgi:hypothetical protein